MTWWLAIIGSSCFFHWFPAYPRSPPRIRDGPSDSETTLWDVHPVRLLHGSSKFPTASEQLEAFRDGVTRDRALGADGHSLWRSHRSKLISMKPQVGFSSIFKLVIMEKICWTCLSLLLVHELSWTITHGLRFEVFTNTSWCLFNTFR